MLAPGALQADVRPTAVHYEVRPLYGHRADGRPGRVVAVRLEGTELKGSFHIDVAVAGKRERVPFTTDSARTATVELLLPPDVGVAKAAKATFTLQADGQRHKATVNIPALRQWTVYLYNHAHVDIGYTNTQDNVERLHKQNIIEGMRLAEQTKDYPEGARYVWNPEIGWPLERLWTTRPEYRDSIVTAIRQGRVCVDASYLNLNTSICADEELFHIFSFTRKMQRLSGQPADVFQQFDIPGISWGLVPVMAQEGVKYILSWTNTDRSGHSHEGLDGRPFWWVGPDGTSKVLFLQPGGYANSGSMKKDEKTGRPWFGQRNPALVPNVIRTGEANVDFTPQLAKLEADGYPYDFAVMSWSLWDNNPIDADIPDAVRRWNETYAFPHIRICGGHEIMAMIEQKYGDKLPVVRGDYTEYWTDGLGTAANLTAKNRAAKEKLIQAETIGGMLTDRGADLRTHCDEAWRYILLGSEHTWTFENPTDPYFQDAIWEQKQAYFHEAEHRAAARLDEALVPLTDKSNGAFDPSGGPSKGGVAVLNTHSWPQSGVVELSAKESVWGDCVVDEKGQAVPSQRLTTGQLLFYAGDVPALGSRHFRLQKGQAKAAGTCRAEGTTLSNGYITVAVNPRTGNISSLTRQGQTHNYIGKGEANSFVWLPANVDKPHADTVTDIRITENGPFVVELCVTSRARGCRSVERRIRLTAGQPWVEIANTVDKLPLREKDGVHFGFDFGLTQPRTRIDIPWGIMEPEKDQWEQANRNWLAVQRWVDMSDAEHGVTWCSLDAPLIEYGVRSANIARGWGTAGDWLRHLNPSTTLYSWVMNNHWHTNFPETQEGPVTFRYRMKPHDAYDVVEANRFGVEQAQPLRHVMASANPDVKPLLAVDNPRVYVTVVKPTAEPRVRIVRLRSVSDRAEDVQLRFPHRRPAHVSRCLLEEQAGEPLAGDRLQMAPYGQITLRLQY